MRKVLCIAIISVLTFSSCSYLRPDISKSLTEKEQLEVMKEHNVLLKEQNTLLSEQNVQLKRIAAAVEKQ